MTLYQFIAEVCALWPALTALQEKDDESLLDGLEMFSRKVASLSRRVWGKEIVQRWQDRITRAVLRQVRRMIEQEQLPCGGPFVQKAIRDAMYAAAEKRIPPLVARGFEELEG